MSRLPEKYGWRGFLGGSSALKLNFQTTESIFLGFHKTYFCLNSLFIKMHLPSTFSKSHSPPKVHILGRQSWFLDGDAKAIMIKQALFYLL